MWIQIRALMRAELRLFFSDRRSVILYLAVPIFIASFIGSLTGGGSGSRQVSMALWIADLDGSALSRGVVSNFVSDVAFRVTVTNDAAVRAQVLAGRVPVGLILPPRFGADAPFGLFDTNRRPNLTLLHDPSRAMEYQVVQGMLIPKVIQSIAENAFSWNGARELANEALRNLERTAALPNDDRSLYRRMLEPVREWVDGQATRETAEAGTTNRPQRPFELPMPFQVTAEAVTARAEAKYNGYAHSFAGIGLQFVLMSMVDLAMGLLRERESGWFKRLRSAPLTRGSVLISKGTAYAVVAVMSLSGCFAFAMAVFGVRIQGSGLGFLLCLVLTSMMSSSLGLMLAAVGKTQGGTRSISIAVILVLVMLGGAWMPTFIFPSWLQTISLFTPTRWAIDAFDAMTWRGLGLEALIGPAAAMLGWTALFSGIALWKFRWESEG